MIETTNSFGEKDRDNSDLHSCLVRLFKGLKEAPTLKGMVLKGGFLMLNTLDNARTTQDIDFSIDKEVGWVNLVQAFKSAVVSLGPETCKIIGYREPQETMSGKIEIEFTKENIIIGIDASWEPLEIGVKHMDILGIGIDAYTLSHILADKYYVIYSKKRFRRTKDLYDIYNILSNFDIDYVEFHDVVAHNRNQINWEHTPMRDEVIVEYKKAWDKLNISVIQDKTMIAVDNKPNFAEVFSVVCNFILEYLSFKDSGMSSGSWMKYGKSGV